MMNSRLAGKTVAAFAVVSALAFSAAPASAAVSFDAVPFSSTQVQLALTPEECSSIRQEIAFLKEMKALAQSELAGATPSQKADLVREIKALTLEIKALSLKLAGCPA